MCSQLTAPRNEPTNGSKDAALLWYAPHLVLDGLQLAAEADGARTANLYVHASSDARGGPDLPWHLQAALAQQRGGRDRPRERPAHRGTCQVPGRRGDSAGVTHQRRRRPAGRQAACPRFPARRLAEAPDPGAKTMRKRWRTWPLIAFRNGAAWFRSVGTREEPGSMLCTLRESDGQVRVVEAALGTPLSWLLALGDDVQAVLSGGYHGGWLSLTAARRLALSNADLRPAGAIAGAGVLDRRCRPAACWAGGDRQRCPFPCSGISWPVRPVLQRAAGDRDRACRAGAATAGRAGWHEPGALGEGLVAGRGAVAIIPDKELSGSSPAR